ncbi:uncharacterized protein LOC116240999 [Phasianus colchicus]|uniref:uncharacterized protein LOC116240999 n=1 Tax=Phasianus colchicus TaxID=9054 RepID=UPI00129D7A84|nr:uncharacterized protein LOC116240999 [Phasianus colchicus]
MTSPRAMTSQRHFRLLQAIVWPQIRPSPPHLRPTAPPQPFSGAGHHLWGRDSLMGQIPLMGQRLTCGSLSHLWVTVTLMGRSSTCGSVRGSVRVFLYGPTSTCGAALWGRASLMGHGPTCGADPHLWGRAQLMGQSVWVAAPLMGRSSTCGSDPSCGAEPHLWDRAPLVGQGSTYGSQLHLWVSAWVHPCPPVGPHPLVGQSYGAELHLWVRAPLVGQSSTYGSVRGSVRVFISGPTSTCGAEPRSAAMGQRYGAGSHLWGRASLMGQSFTYFWGSAPLRGHGPTYGSVCMGWRCGAEPWRVAMGQSPTYGAERHLWV